MDSSGFLRVSWLLLIGFGVLSVAFFLTLVVVRVTRDAWEQRTQRIAEGVRAQIFDLLMGEGDEAVRARQALESFSGPAWDRIEAQVFTMLPKLKGDSRSELVSLLLAKGAEGHALSLVRSRSGVRRCRGAFQLGVLGLSSHVDELVERLSDKRFLVRRVALRALGNIGDPRAVRPLLLLGERDNRLTRDLVYALDRMGPGAAPELRAVLRDEMSSGEHLHLDPAAVVLGLLGDVESVGVLAEGLASPNPSFAGACAEALGRIGSPESIPALSAALLDPRPNVRAGAAHALGMVGSPESVQSLIEVVDEEEPQVSRQAAQALLELGPEARTLLEASTSPYAVEAVALQAIRGRR